MESLSVIIPTLNEEKFLGQTLDGLLRTPASFEIIVSDGGSSDRTLPIAAGYFPRVRHIQSAPGRAQQMNAGAQTASGTLLLFLHADTYLEPGWFPLLMEQLGNGQVIGGAFTFAIPRKKNFYRFLECTVALRSKWLGLPYGDQAIFVRREVFQELNGYGNLPLMEDVDLVQRLKKRGKLCILSKRAFTSPRRWERYGLVRTSLRNTWLCLRFLLTVQVEKPAGENGTDVRPATRRRAENQRAPRQYGWE